MNDEAEYWPPGEVVELADGRRMRVVSGTIVVEES